ncbi:hypothetical protein [Candidatus Parabeggiatoa sp. HSG14]|uniref:NACHT and WD repeat domain-containing protein n=1 Tax=Candidatus Parabeggiatoa sp. HSG14 TaxID=3055593 RepID=UPI0025A74AF6|nr:hypothetical protein [Thiotrichales bacterium HSG14]
MSSEETQAGISIGDVTGNVSLQAGGDIVAGNKTVIQNIIQQAVKKLTTSPYKFLAAYDISDRDIFYGRSAIIEDLAGKVPRYKTLIINGASGSGKSSLVNAGLIPRLAENGYTYISFREYSDPLQQLRDYLSQQYLATNEVPPLEKGTDAPNKKGLGEISQNASLLQLLQLIKEKQDSHLVVIFDQFERFLVNVLPEKRHSFIEALKHCMDSNLSTQEMNFVFVLRQDFFGQMLAEMETVIPTFLNESARLNLQSLSKIEAREAIIKPLENLEVKMGYDEEFVDDVLLAGLAAQTTEHTGINPPHLQIVCNQLYEAAHRQLKQKSMVVINKKLYDELGGAQAILHTYLDKTIEDIAHDPEKTAIVRSMLKAMIETMGTRKFVSLENLHRALPDVNETEIFQFLEKLLERRVIELRKPNYSLSHDFMVEKVRSWFDEREMERQKARETLERGIAEWKNSEAFLNEKQVSNIRHWLTDLNETEQQLLTKSEVAYTAIKHKEEEQRQLLAASNESRKKSIRIGIIASMLLTVLALGFAISTNLQKKQALRSQSLFLSDLSWQETEKGNTTNGILLALEALPTQGSKRPFVSEARVALYGAVLQHRPHLILTGHKQGVNHAAFNPNGQLVVSASDDKTAHLWHVETGEQQVDFIGHNDEVLFATFSPDGKRVATASKDNTARLWNAKTGQQLVELKGHDRVVYHVQFSPDGNQIITASGDKTARLWAVDTGKQLAMLKGHRSTVGYATFSPDGQRMVTASWDKTARLWNTKTGQAYAILNGHKSFVYHAQFSPDGQRVVTASYDKTARLWDANTGQLLTELNGHEGFVYRTQFSPDGKRVITASQDKTARLWEVETGQQLVILQGHEKAVNHAKFSPNGQYIITASNDKTARLWEANTGKQVALLQDHENEVTYAEFSHDGQHIVAASMDKTVSLWKADVDNQSVVLKGHNNKINSARFSPDGQSIISASKDKTARLWEVNTGQQLNVLEGHQDEIKYAAFSPDGQRVVTASYDTTARVWDTKTGNSIAELKGHNSFVYHAQFSSDGQRVVTASKDKTAGVWTVDNQQLVHQLKGHQSDVWTAQFSPNGQLILTASKDKTARLWNANTGEQIAILEGHQADVKYATFDKHGQHIITTSKDKTARLWVVNLAKSFNTLKGHQAEVTYAAFNPADEVRIVTASKDKTARLWSANIGLQRAVLKGHQDEISYATFSLNGQFVVTASDDKTARIWDVATGGQLAVLEGHKNKVTYAQFSPNSEHIITASEDNTMRLWQFKVFRTLQGLVDYAYEIVPRKQLTPEQRKHFFLQIN